MPFVTVDNIRLFYRLEGAADRPVLVLSHSIGTDMGLWAPQVEDLLPHFQILRYDTRGHGASDAPNGEYSVERLGRDLIELVDALNISRFAFCGLSMGGAIGQWLAVNTPDRLKRPGSGQYFPAIRTAFELGKSNSDGQRKGDGRNCGNGDAALLLFRDAGSR